MKKFLLGIGLWVVLFVTAFAVVYADPPTPHQPPRGKPTSSPASNGAAVDKGSKRHAVFGTISGLGANTFTVSTKQGDVLVTVTDKTKYHIPTIRPGAFGNLAMGDQVAVNGTPNDSGLIAKQVAVVPGKPTIQHRVGTVSAYSPNSSLTLTDAKGGTATFVLTKETEIRNPKGSGVSIGDKVTVVSRREPGSNTFTATAIVVHPK
jgi:hypothetical protein